MVKQLYLIILLIHIIILQLENCINKFKEKLSSEIKKMIFMHFMRQERLKIGHKSTLRVRLYIKEGVFQKYQEIIVDLQISNIQDILILEKQMLYIIHIQVQILMSRFQVTQQREKIQYFSNKMIQMEHKKPKKKQKFYREMTDYYKIKFKNYVQTN